MSITDNVNLIEIENAVKTCLSTIDTTDYITSLEAVYAEGHNLLKLTGVEKKYKMSSGVSNVHAPSQYIAIAADSLSNHTSYRNYAPPQGDVDARKAIALKESSEIKPYNCYTENDVCITDGASGAISGVFEYISKGYSNAEVLIPCPNYYLFRLCAKQYGLRYTEVAPNTHPKTSELVSPMSSIIASINDNTRLIIITSPSNPTGEIYNEQDISELLMIAKKKDIFILFDEVFKELTYDPAYLPKHKALAEDANALELAIFINSLSKSKNMPGIRAGYVCAKDRRLIQSIVKAQEVRSFNAGASNFKEVIILDSFYAQSIESMHRTGQDVTHLVDSQYALYDQAHINLPYEKTELVKGIEEHRRYISDVLATYKQNKRTIMETLGKYVDWQPDNAAAFNTFVRVDRLRNTDAFDFSLNLFLFYGVKTQAGPYFGFTPKKWREEYGFWLRFSYSMSELDMKSGAEKLAHFIDDYIEHPERYIHLNMEFAS